MARPSKQTIASGLQGWDALADDNDSIILSAPFPMHEHTGDETDLAATFPAASYDRCWVMVDHTTLGWTVYISDGATWRLHGKVTPTAVTALTDSTGGSANNTLVAISGSGADSDINNNFADLAAKVNELRTLLVNNGLAS